MHARLLSIAILLAAGCGHTDGPLEAAGGGQGKADGYGAPLVQRAVSLDDEQRFNAALGTAGTYRLLGDAGGRRLLVSPAIPGPSDAISVLADLGKPFAGSCGVAGEVVYSYDAWKTVHKTTASVHKTLLAFSLGKAAVGTKVELAVRVDACYQGTFSTAYWLNNNGANYQVLVREPRALTFLGQRAAFVQGLGLALDGRATTFAAQDLSITAQTYPVAPGKGPTLHFSVDGKPAQSVAMRYDTDGAGPYGNNAQWVGAIPAALLVPNARVQLWLSAGSLWDSNLGANYRVSVGEPARVAWAGAGQFTFTKFAKGCETRLKPGADYYNWCFSSGLGDPFTASYSIYQAYASFTHLALEVYVPGVTDRALTDAEAAAIGAQFIRAELSSDLLSGKAGGAWGTAAMQYVTRRGNNFVYELMPYCPGGGAIFCPLGTTIADGDYAYKFRVSVDGGTSWTWIGRPQDGANRTLRWKFAH